MRGRAVAAIGFVGAASAWSAPAAAPFAPALAHALGISRRLTTARGVALTFDDGPHAQGTPAVLEVLDRAGAAATFFLVGEQVRRNAALASEIVAGGHEVAVHGYRHRLHTVRMPRELDDDLRRAIATIEDATGQATACYRPPYGVFSPASLRLVRRSGRRPTLWSRWAVDWRAHVTPAEIARRSTASLRAGDIVLLHDADHYASDGSWCRTVSALPLILEAVVALGEPFVCISASQSM
jgi:peptidoglycan/xylan/chitin deacetylase (PgdA/CDA1 family)